MKARLVATLAAIAICVPVAAKAARRATPVRRATQVHRATLVRRESKRDNSLPRGQKERPTALPRAGVGR